MRNILSFSFVLPSSVAFAIDQAYELAEAQGAAMSGVSCWMDCDRFVSLLA